MGGQTSKTRKFTLENEEPRNVIKVSDEVVSRLRKSMEEVRKKAAAEQPPLYASGVEGQPPPFYHYEPSLTSLKIRQEAVDNLKKNDEYWENRIKDLEKRHEKMRVIMEEEFTKAVEDFRVTRLREPAECPELCTNVKKNVVDCYKMYSREPMRCAKEVQAFTACVDSNRITIVEEARCTAVKAS
ncbi:coiled-coil-helix-coiled-coil-helix domain containing 6 [Holotrichia oblita]|uniref:Coiled-coil-helix-coiled-coil-helix domain containing 6 n=1 Tax=Holotrichia oblita TaxID=644536 RepID=A0ACB9TUM7_HOLOL|nr:coiled-coil-helix-coiled-coil-helix domain containing 6 [Holotrichia oblita]